MAKFRVLEGVVPVSVVTESLPQPIYRFSFLARVQSDNPARPGVPGRFFTTNKDYSLRLASVGQDKLDQLAATILNYHKRTYEGIFVLIVNGVRSTGAPKWYENVTQDSEPPDERSRFLVSVTKSGVYDIQLS